MESSTTKNNNQSRRMHSKPKLAKNKIWREIQLNTETMNSQLIKRSKTFVWRFMTPTLNEEDEFTLRMLAQRIKSVKTTRKIYLDCKWLNETNSEINFLVESFRRHAGLKKISCSSQACFDLDDETLESLCRGLKKMRFLQHLVLDFRHFDSITERGLDCLGKNLKKMCSLRFLNLGFPGCKYVTDKAIELLGKGIRRLTLLQSLCFFFVCCEGLTDVVLTSLSLDIRKLKSLKNLHLNCYNCEKISDLGVKDLSEALKGMNSLQQISFSFSLNDKVTNESLKNLGEGMKGLKSLKKLNLTFSRCSQVSDEGIYELCQGLKQIDLKVMETMFVGCPLVTKEGENYLRKSMKSDRMFSMIYSAK